MTLLKRCWKEESLIPMDTHNTQRPTHIHPYIYIHTLLCHTLWSDQVKLRKCPQYDTSLIRWWGSSSGALRSVESPLCCHYSQVHSDPDERHLFGSHQDVKSLWLKMIRIRLEYLKLYNYVQRNHYYYLIRIVIWNHIIACSKKKWLRHGIVQQALTCRKTNDLTT